jgi:hypothetical protein
MQDEVVIKYNFITDNEIKKLLHFFNESKNIRKFRDTFVLDLEDNFLDLKNKFNQFNPNFQIDWWQIVQWPEGSYQAFHLDKVSNKTKLTSITYLNDNFKGGETLFFDGTKIAPYPSKTMFFDGQLFQHSVSTVLQNTRYTLACWYKNKYE